MEEFDGLEPETDKKKIIEKLDNENNYAPIHYAVLSNNKDVFEYLLKPKFKCGNN